MLTAVTLLHVASPEFRTLCNKLCTSDQYLPVSITTFLHSVSTHLTPLGTPYTWNHAIFVPSRLASFTKHNALQVHPSCYKWRDFLLFKGWIIFQCVCAHAHVLYPFIFWHSCYFHILGIVNNAEQGSADDLVKILITFSLKAYLEIRRLDHKVVLFLIFWGNSILFSLSAVPIYIPATGHKGPLLSTCSLALVLHLSANSHSDRREVTSHCGFDLHSSDDSWNWAPF